MPDFSILSSPNFTAAALGGFQAGQALGRQKRLDAALGAVDLSRPETIMPVLQADPQTGAQLITAAAGVRKTADQTRAREIIPQAVGGDKAAISELWGLDPDVAGKLTDDHIKLVDQGVKSAGNAALGLLQLPEGQRSSAWDAAIDSLDEQFPGLAQYKGQYSATNLQSVLAQAGMSKDAIDLTMPKYQPLVPNGTLGQSNPLAGPIYGGGQPGGGDPVSSGGVRGRGDVSRLINTDAGGGYVPDAVQTLGQFVDFGRNMNRSGAKSSSAGTYQINGTTMADFAPKALGEGWQSAPFNAESQDKVGRAIFDWARQQDNPSAALRGRWVSLSPQSADRLVKGSWEDARGVIAQGETGGSEASSASIRSGLKPPRVGAERIGAGGIKYRFKGGDQASRDSWERVG